MKNNQSGIVILITLWIMAILTIFALGIGYRTSLELRLARYQMDKIRTLYITKAAVQDVKQYMVIDLDSNSNTKDYDSLYCCGVYFSSEDTPEKLFKDIPVGGGSYNIKYKIGKDENNQPIWRYGLSDEERKININKADLDTLKFLFQLLDIELSKGESVSASIIDWRDADSTPVNDYGAENDYYQNLENPYNCKNADFETLEELLLVKDVTLEIFSKVKNYITVYGEGKVNINTVSSLVLQALALRAELDGDPAILANKLIDYRSGNDKIDGNADDMPCIPSPSASILNYLNQALADLTVPAGVIANLSNNYLSAKSANFRVEIQAASSDNKVVKNTTVILDTSGKVKLWQEE